MDMSATARQTRVDRLLDRVVRRLAPRVESAANVGAIRIVVSDGPERIVGSGVPTFSVRCNRQGLKAIASRDEVSVANAYVDGSIDFDGHMLDVLRCREILIDKRPLEYFWSVFIKPRLFGQINQDRKWISQHYDYDQEFYLLFLDRATRTYSHGVFHAPDESLEVAMQRKLEFALNACRLEPGKRVLDIGGGWGAFVRFAGSRGIEVTSLTLSEKSHAFLQNLIAESRLPCEARLEHFFDHHVERPYDAIVNLGVTEHLPDYRRTLRKYRELLAPGGRVYLDASAGFSKYGFSTFITRYIYPGNPSPMYFPEYVEEVARSPFEIVSVANDRHSYALTASKWAENLERARNEIVKRWGEELFRRFRLYLWGTAHAFITGLMTAYRVVLELPDDSDHRFANSGMNLRGRQSAAGEIG